MENFTMPWFYFITQKIFADYLITKPWTLMQVCGRLNGRIWPQCSLMWSKLERNVLKIYFFFNSFHTSKHSCCVSSPELHWPLTDAQHVKQHDHTAGKLCEIRETFTINQCFWTWTGGNLRFLGAPFPPHLNSYRMSWILESGEEIKMFMRTGLGNINK